MKRGRIPRLVLWLAGTVLVLGAGGAFLTRDALRERWWLHRLDSGDDAVRGAVADKLGKHGGERAARALVAGLQSSRPLPVEAVAALEAILPRLTPGARRWIVTQLLDCLRRAERATAHADHSSIGDFVIEAPGSTIEPALRAFLARAARLHPELLETFAAALEAGDPGALCAGVLVRAWPRSRTAVEAALTTLLPAKIEELLESFLQLARGDVGTTPGEGTLEPQQVRELLADIARRHPRPEPRAVALCKAFVAPGAAGGLTVENDLPADAYASDPAPLVRRAALMLASLGRPKTRLDLRAVVRDETDTALLTTAIQARLVRTRSWQLSSLELAPGLVTSLGDDSGRHEARQDALAPEELARLRAILDAATDAPLRDAAAAALATAAAATSRKGPVRAPGLSVHEWGVWRMGPQGLGAVEAKLAELPSFVHRSRVAFDDLAPEHAEVELRSFSFKPIIYFHAREPVSLLLRVYHLGGCPWAYFPDASAYISLDGNDPGRSHLDTFLRPSRSAAPFVGPPGKLYWEGRTEALPPWLRPDAAAAPARPKGRTARRRSSGPCEEAKADLAGKHLLIPWDADPIPRVDFDELRGLGLEWRGLRVGYAPGLEGEPRPLTDSAGEASWWARLRRVASSPVAFRGEREGFLFYDGSIHTPSPVAVRWADASRRALSIGTVDFLSLPHLRQWRTFEPDAFEARGETYPPETANVPAALVVHKRPGSPARGRLLASLGSRSAPIAVPLETLELEGEAIEAALLRVLTGEGLTAEEAQALVDVWRREFFVTDGLRVLTVLPRWLYDAVLPMQIDPRPAEIVRVGVSLQECDALEVDEREAMAPRGDLGDSEPIAASVARVELRSSPSEQGPPVPFEVGPDGKLLGIALGSHTLHPSDDGRYLAHPRTNLTGFELYIGDLERREFRSACRLGTAVELEDYGFSGDGGRAALLVTSEGRHRMLVVDARRQALLEAEGPFGVLDWSSLSRDGRYVSYLEDRKPRVLDLEARQVLRLELPAGTLAAFPMISADGKQLASILEKHVKTRKPDGEEGEEVTSELSLVDLEARTWRRLARVLGSYYFPVLAPDGRRVAFVSSCAGDSWLLVADLAAGRLLPIAPCSPDTRLRRIADDGVTLLYSIGDEIWTTSLETGASRRLHAPAGRGLRDGWMTADGRRAFYRGFSIESRRFEGFFTIDLSH